MGDCSTGLDIARHLFDLFIRGWDGRNGLLRLCVRYVVVNCPVMLDDLAV